MGALTFTEPPLLISVRRLPSTVTSPPRTSTGPWAAMPTFPVPPSTDTPFRAVNVTLTGQFERPAPRFQGDAVGRPDGDLFLGLDGHAAVAADDDGGALAVEVDGELAVTGTEPDALRTVGRVQQLQLVSALRREGAAVHRTGGGIDEFAPTSCASRTSCAARSTGRTGRTGGS